MLQSKLHIGLAAMLTVLAFQLCAAGPAVAAKLVPLFPDQRSGLTVVEAEDALSTNMASEPTLVYGCSGDRALQCSRTSQLRGGEPYYVDFAVFVDAAGSYQLWYGGTPPGPRDQYAPSYFSPLTVALDGGNPKPLYREDVTVAAQYSPTYYWVKTPALDLSAGADIIRFAIAEPRRVDKRYVFNIDLVLLATADALAAATPDELPPGFNTGGGAAPSDIQIRSLEDYQSFIASSPTSLAAYASLADDYSLIGDYLNALKTLSRALVVAPDKPEFLLLSAKNRLWRGDVREGLDMYRRYIAVRHDDIHAYEEAGKVAAWSGQYAESEEFYREGLAVFPADLSLLVNLGLAQLWASQGADAQKSFGQAEALALTKPELTLRLASIYKANGYPEKSIALLDQG
ncbi:MAG TPA: hypothetical protein VMC79_02985, partial [Rectinemataceae bacterium]|nr:hypothetical protein [Rectinemataceae bacterium]